MTNDIISSLSPEQIEEMINNPGQTFGGSVGEAPTSFKAQAHVDISNRAAQGVRPRVSGNETHDVTGGRINRPSAALPQKLADGDEKIRREAAAQRLAEIEAKEAASPVTINARLAYLERQQKKLQNSLNKLIKQIDTLTATNNNES